MSEGTLDRGDSLINNRKAQSLDVPNTFRIEFYAVLSSERSLLIYREFVFEPFSGVTLDTQMC